MSREWKPGDVVAIDASYSVFHRKRGVVVADAEEGLAVVVPDVGADAMAFGSKTLRPLVVIDPEDREQVERLVSAVLTADAAHHEGRACYSTTCHADRMQAALREFANPKPLSCSSRPPRS